MVRNNKDLKGNKYGRLLVVGLNRKEQKYNKNGAKDGNCYFWDCMCDCGKSVVVVSESLVYGNTKSCGCLRRELAVGTSVDKTGDRHGRLVITGLNHVRITPSGIRVKIWDCECDCGNTTTVRASDLSSGRTKSCGCLQKKLTAERSTIHGWSSIYDPEKRRAYNIWLGMKKRCYKKDDNGYHLYGGRGIKICDKWLESFDNFYEDMGPSPSSEHSIDRINNDGDYCPENCRWATKIEQSNNRSDNVICSILGEDFTLAEAARTFDVPYHRVTRYFYKNKEDFENLVLSESPIYNQAALTVAKIISIRSKSL
jgi:hypothetical protein